MTNKLRHRDIGLLIVLAALFLLLQGLAVKAERLSFKNYSAADGLVSDDVSKIVADSRGFLWFCTVEGLSRFDGYKFKNYTQEQGLPHQSVNDLLETADGDYLVATSNGLAVLNPTGTAYPWNISEGRLEQASDEPPLFKTYFLDTTRAADSPKRIHSLAQDSTGQIYAAGSRGVYRVVKNDGDWTLEKIVFEAWESKTTAINLLFTDSRKDVWIGTSNGVYRTTKSGEIQQILDTGSNSIFEDRDGRMWIDSGGADFGIRILEVGRDRSNVVLVKTLTTKDGFAQNKFTNAIAHTKDGRIFVTSQNKLYEYFPDSSSADGRHFKLLDNTVVRATTDLSDNVWFIIGGRGVSKYSPSSFVIYDQRDGVPDDFIRSVTSNRAGEVFVTEGSQNLTRRDLDGKFETVVPFGLGSRNWTHNFLDLQARDGEWWVPSTHGLRRYANVTKFADLATTPPKHVYTTADGLFGDGVFAIFEDSRGDIWLSTNSEAGSVVRFERSTQTLHRYSETGAGPNSFALAFGEDAAGNIWISFYLGELARYKDGVFRAFTAADGFPKGIVASMLSDKKDRFWLTSESRGLFRIDNPNDDAPTFASFSARDGLSTDRTLCLTEDDLGRIYVGTGRGINRLEPDLPRVKVFTQADGLPGNIVSGCHKSSDGKLWFSSNSSLIQLASQAEPPAKPPLVFIDSLAVNGNQRSISDLGETEIRGLEFDSDEKQVQIGFFAISLDTGEALRYQYKLNEQEWSEPSERRTIDFNLSPASYQLSVRAITADGVLSENSAVISMTIARPIWQRWWFVTLAILILGSITFVVVRYRLTKIREVRTALEALNRSRAERLAELHRVRTRIATDLHDDIGSSLTQIAVLSEVARNQADALESDGISTKLESIKGVSRELVESMSDVVWAINPNKDNLSDLVQRMRRFGSDYCAARDIRFELDAPPTDEMIPLGANLRREIFAIFKEVVNNSVKYSECKNVRADFWIENDNLLLKIVDDGQGFDTETMLSPDFAPDIGGNGLVNIRRRASELGGNCEISSKIGDGTTVLLLVPLNLSEIDILSPAQLGGESDHDTRV